MPLDRTFLRPIAHRGLHDDGRRVTENTAAAFEAAIAAGCGIECDLRPSADGLPVVFHDDTLERLVGTNAPVDRIWPSELKTLRHKSCGSPILTFGEMLELVDGRVPILAEIKSDWQAAHPRFLGQVTAIAAASAGPVALMSFDPDYMEMVHGLAPMLPRGLIATSFTGRGWWNQYFDADRAYRLANFLESRHVAPDFYAYDVKHMPNPITDFIRQVLREPVFAWTVRSEDDRRTALQWADAPIFEGEVPALPDPASRALRSTI